MNDHPKLFPYQIEGSDWLKTKRFALLSDEMGLGKSAQAIRAADLASCYRILVLCPAIARTNWHREFEKFSSMPRKFELVFSKSHPSTNSNASIICSYDLATCYEPAFFGRFDLLILDEAHYLKSPKTKRTASVFGKEGYVRYAKKIWALSGTPAPNHAGELWPLLYTFGIVPQLYGAFIETYCNFIDTAYGRQITGTKQTSMPELKRVLKTIMLRRRTKDVLTELPKLFFQDLKVEADDSNIDIDFINDPRFKAEQAILEQTFGHLDMNSDQAFGALEALAGSISTLRRYLGLKKVSPICALIKEEFSNKTYDKIVIFAVHTQVVEELAKKLAEFDPVVVSGSTPPHRRQYNVDKFQTRPTCKVFIGNIQAAGTAITLTKAHHVIFVEQDWVPGNNAQAAKRCHRISQENPVFVRTVGLSGSLDEHIQAILSRKSRELANLFNDERKPLDIFTPTE